MNGVRRFLIGGGAANKEEPMPRSRKVLGIAVVAVVLVAVGAAANGPDRGSLLAAWEAAVQVDPQTLRFERLEDGRYAFATERFPFDGTIEVVEVVIDDRNLEGPLATATGQVVVELEGVDDEFRRRHATSLGIWETGNTLFWDPDDERWVESADWARRIQESFGWSWAGWISSGFWILLLVAVVVVLTLVSRRATGQMKRAMAAQDRALEDQQQALEMNREALELTREANRLLAEILAELRARPDR